MKTARKHWVQEQLMGDHIIWKIAEARYQDYFGSNFKSEEWSCGTIEKVNIMFRRKEVVEVLQKTCMDDYIELLGLTVK
ncbi:hypothetical protein B9Z55_007792 [Caenorhabditis nigoni]|uniref:Uncharacterized protein n=1 Tax=Caenorhabditis nigoni TaxID=1611254 RepID=A0A2G5VBY6_9PELO|nr:hypothetical protein B9Z55_007792 [Caenorhabditis nigoni]